MTPEERDNPELLNMSRKRRIAKGCGQDMNDINAFIKQFDQMRKMMHKMSKMPGMGAAGPGGKMPGVSARARARRKRKKRRRR